MVQVTTIRASQMAGTGSRPDYSLPSAVPLSCALAQCQAATTCACAVLSGALPGKQTRGALAASFITTSLLCSLPQR